MTRDAYLEKYNRALDVLRQAGVPEKQIDSALLRGFQKLGFRPRPMLFSTWPAQILLSGGFFAAIWIPAAWIATHRRWWVNAPEELASPVTAIIAGAVFGGYVAWHLAKQRKTLRLPAWSEV